MLMGCASMNEAPKTVSSDLFPKSVNRANYYYEMAQASSTDSQHEKAVDFSRLAIAHDPNNTLYRIQLIKDLQFLNLDRETVQEITQLLRIAEQDPKLASLLFNILLKQKMYDDAKHLYLSWSQRDVKETRWLWGLYSIAVIKGNRIDQLDQLSRIAYLQPNNYWVWSSYANTYGHLGDKINEEKTALKSYELNRNQEQIVLRLSRLAEEKGNISTASNYLKQYTLTNPFNGTISNYYANVLMHEKSYDLADEEYTKQLRFVENASLILLKKAHIKYLQKDYNQAYKQYEKILTTNPSDEGYYYLGLTCQSLDKPCAENSFARVMPESNYYIDASLRLINQEANLSKALNLSETSYMARMDSTELLKIYAELLIRNNLIRKAEKVLVKAGKSHLKNSDIVLLHAYVKHRLGDTETFKRLIHAALKMNPDNASIYSSLAKIWYDNNESPKDTEFFARTSVQLGNKNLDNKLILAWSLFKQQKVQQAMPLFEEAYEQSSQKVQPADHLATIYKWAYVFIRSDEFATYANEKALNPNKDSDSSLLITQPEAPPQRLPASFLAP